jgi:hypothetical protein
MASKFDADRVLAVSAMAVSIGTLAALGYSTYLTRQAQHASVLPYLYVALSSNERGANLLLENTGIGPALVDDVRIHYQGRDVFADPYDFYLGLHPEQKGLAVDHVAPGRLIPAGATLQMFGSVDPQFLKPLLQLFDVSDVPDSWYEGQGMTRKNKAVIEITFSSVYGDRWRIRSDRVVPERF